MSSDDHSNMNSMEDKTGLIILACMCAIFFILLAWKSHSLAQIASFNPSITQQVRKATLREANFHSWGVTLHLIDNDNGFETIPFCRNKEQQIKQLKGVLQLGKQLDFETTQYMGETFIMNIHCDNRIFYSTADVRSAITAQRNSATTLVAGLLLASIFCMYCLFRIRNAIQHENMKPQTNQ